jgi:hypothetical protein
MNQEGDTDSMVIPVIITLHVGGNEFNLKKLYV